MSLLFHYIFTLQPPFAMIVIVVMIAAAAGTVGTIAKQIRLYACHCREVELKREPVDRGMGVDDIERVMSASAVGADDNRSGAHVRFRRESHA